MKKQPKRTRQQPPEANPIPARVEIWDISANKMLREYEVNNIKSCRDWLHRLNIWAVSNGYGLQIQPR